jgi:hypothetical protein
MIQFNSAKLRAVYVYIVKVTSDYVYVSGHRNGDVFSQSSAIINYHGRDVSKIKIHRSVSHGFFKNNVMKEFSSPRLATLNYYGGDIISIEIQMFNMRLKRFQDADKWQSNFSKVLMKLEKRMNEVEEAWINGSEVFWLNKEDKHDVFDLSVDGSLKLRKVKYIKLSKMGLNNKQLLNTKSEITAVNEEQPELLLDLENQAELYIGDGKVLAYYPNAAFPDEQQIVVYSPVLSSLSSTDKRAKKPENNSLTEKDEEKKVYLINSESNPCYPNIEFALKAAKTIGKLYGFAETYFLNIPSIIIKTGEVNFYNIEQESRMNTPIDMSAITCIGWLFGFIYREENLNKMRELSSMFKFVINKGLVFKNDIMNDFKEDAPSGEIPLNKFNSEKEFRTLIAKILSDSGEINNTEESISSDLLKSA